MLTAQKNTSAMYLSVGIFAEITQRISAFVAYRNTVRELDSLPLDTLLDLGLDPTGLKLAAKNAVYGS